MPTQQAEEATKCDQSGTAELVAFTVAHPKFTAVPADSPNSEDFVSIYAYIRVQLLHWMEP